MAFVVQRGPTQADLNRRQRQREFGQNTRLARRQIRLRERQQDFVEQQRDVDNEFRLAELDMRRQGLQSSLVNDEFRREMQERERAFAEEQALVRNQLAQDQLILEQRRVEQAEQRIGLEESALEQNDPERRARVQQQQYVIQELGNLPEPDLERVTYHSMARERMNKLRSQAFSIQADPSLDNDRKIQQLQAIRDDYVRVLQSGQEKVEPTAQERHQSNIYRNDELGFVFEVDENGVGRPIKDLREGERAAAERDREIASRAAEYAAKKIDDMLLDGDLTIDPSSASGAAERMRYEQMFIRHYVELLRKAQRILSEPRSSIDDDVRRGWSKFFDTSFN